MATEKPSPAVEAAFDEMLDDATHAAFDCFFAIGLPDKDSQQGVALLEQLNDAIRNVMQEWK